MNPFSHLGLDEQFWLPPIAPPMSLAEALEQRNREAVDGLCVEENDDE
ncbi:TPA: hypothetical protein ACXNG6_000205 [Stenotrophomonas maltophilia]